jgi:membrane protease YdiL (CAAX protease family)
VFGALYVGFSLFIERKPVRELDLAGGGREFGQGVLVGAGLYTLCVVVLMVLGIYRIEGFNSAAFLLPAITMALSSGIFEELLFRGVLHRSIEDVFGSWAALFVSALLFGLFHLFNPAGTLAGALFIAVEAGILLSAAFLLTGKLWMSMGFHISWNYTQSAIFSGIVSGGVADPGLIRANIVGPDALTGGSFGIEASWIALTVCTITGLTLLRGAVRRGNMRPPIWARPVAPAAA